MKIAVTGKGGVGKTTTAGTLSRFIAKQGFEVIALDCDANPNLGLSLGLSLEETDRLAAVRQSLDMEEGEHAPTIPEILERFGTIAPDGVQIVIASRIDNFTSG